jgi:alpha-D-ribose 1-methylphosphonate 5-triphosphate synthase subunit PhnH
MPISDKDKVTLETFRALMKSMANPGTLVKPGPQSRYGIDAVCSALLDHEVGFSVIGPGAHDELIGRIYEETKSEYKRSDLADYVIVAGGSSSGGIRSLRRGTLEFPDSSATVIYMVRELGSAGGLKLNLKGPGIKTEMDLVIDGVNIKDIMDIREMNSEFPLGIDIVFIDDSGIVCSIPRSASIGLGE